MPTFSRLVRQAAQLSKTGNLFNSRSLTQLSEVNYDLFTISPSVTTQLTSYQLPVTSYQLPVTQGKRIYFPLHYSEDWGICLSYHY